MTTLVITRLTLHEAVSRRLLLAGALISLAFVALFATGFHFVYREVQQAPSGLSATRLAAAQMTLMGLYGLNFLAGFLAIFVSVNSVSGEIDSGTLHAVLAHPMRRLEFVAGRWLAFALLMAVYLSVMVALMLLVAWRIAGYLPPDPPRALALMLVGMLGLLTLSVFGSAVLSTLANGVVMFTLFGLAWLGGVVEFIGQIVSSEAMLNLSTVVSLLVPSDAVWRGASHYLVSVRDTAALAGPNPFGGGPPPTTALVIWALAYPLVLLLAAVRAFSRRDL